MSNTVPSTIYSDVNPVAQKYGVPTWLWEDIASVESGFNPKAVGDNGTSFGLFQLHIGGQLPAQYNNNPQPVFDPTLNANIAMPAIASAWSSLGSSFSNTLQWWEQFAAASGHPGGSPTEQVTINEATALNTQYPNFSNNGSTNCGTCSPVDRVRCMLLPNGGVNDASCAACFCSNATAQVPVITGASQGLSGITTFFQNMSDPKFLERMLVIGVGGILILIALVKLI